MNRQTQGAAITVWLVAFLMLIAGCYIPADPGGPTAQPPTAQAPWDDPDAITGLPTCESVEGEFLALGVQEEILRNLEAVRESTGIEFEVVETLEGGDIWLNRAYDAKSEEGQASDETDERQPFDAFLRVQVVNTDDDRADDRFVEELRERQISASLNYTTTLFGHSGGDSPFGEEPHPAPRPPSGTPDIAAQDALYAVMEVQQALETPTPVPDAQDMETKEIVVGVFDTAPEIDGNVVHEFWWLEDQILKHGAGASWYTAATPTPNSRDHGLFVSSLIDAVAPESQVVLYRVLGDSGQGSTADIFRQTLAFLAEYPPSKDTPRVLNYSLGIECDEPAPKDWLLPLSPLAALNLLLDTAEDHGAVIVAAAGNDSNRLEQPHRDPYILDAAYPASAEFAIGVGSTDLKGRLSCYTHTADVFAPGGDGNSDTSPAAGSTPIPIDAVNHCVPYHTSCVDGSCNYGLLGLSAESPTHYAFWPGTSFAAPLVSGLMARYLALHGDPMPPAPRTWVLECAQESDGQEVMASIANCPPVR